MRSSATPRGPPEVLKVEEVPPPPPRAGEILTRVRAASVNPADRAPPTGEPPDIRALPQRFAPRRSAGA